MLRSLRRVGHLEQTQESFLHRILGFRVGKTQRATVKNKLGRLGVIQSFAPRRCLSVIYSRFIGVHFTS